MTIKPAGRGPQIIAIYSFFVGLTTITLALRLYCRTYIQKAFGWDDYFASFAWVSFIHVSVKSVISDSECTGLLHNIRLMCDDWSPSRHRTTC